MGSFSLRSSEQLGASTFQHQGSRLVDLLAPICQSLTHAADLLSVQHARLHPADVDGAANLIDCADNELQSVTICVQ